MMVIKMLNEEDAIAIEHLLGTKEDKLSPWEVDFLETISEQLYLSKKQQELLDKIWEKYGSDL